MGTTRICGQQVMNMLCSIFLLCEVVYIPVNCMEKVDIRELQCMLGRVKYLVYHRRRLVIVIIHSIIML